ncbi:MAG: DNA topoisomerase IB [Acidimicrobiia bacterium]
MESDGLRYVSDETPGFRRRRAGRGFIYLDRRGRRLTSPSHVARIERLAIPPAWTDVWICPDPHGHLQATGRDARGRKQYRYHPDWRARKEAGKYEHMVDFGAALPRIRRRVAADYALPGLPLDKVTAAVVHLLETSLIRIGNDEYARSNNSYGLTTLRDRHVRFDSGEIRFSFAGKSGKEHTVTVHDARTARIVRRCRDLPGQRLFQYVGDDGRRRHLESTHVNEYLRDAGGADFTAKDFRTWVGTLFAAVALDALDVPDSDAEGRRNASLAISAVSRRLGNTPTVARNSYVHPDVVDLYVDGRLHDLWHRRPARDGKWFLAEEKRLLDVLREARRLQRRNGTAARAGATRD